MRPILKALRSIKSNKISGNNERLDCTHNDRDGDIWCDGCDEGTEYYSNSEFSFISNSSSDDYINFYRNEKQSQSISPRSQSIPTTANINEFERENVELQYMLKITEQLNSTSHNLINSVFQQIINDVFGGIQNVIKALAAHSNYDQLQQIHHIINDQHQQNIGIKTTDSKQSIQETQIAETTQISITDNTAKKEKNINNNNFDKLCKGSISNICAYLSRKDIKSFKLCSNRIGVICLEEMNKYSVGILNMNALIHPYFKSNSNNFDLEQHIKFSRYNGNKTLSFLQERWNTEYKIDEKYQLIFPYDKKKRDDTIIKILDSTLQKFKISHLPNTKIHDLYPFGGQRRYLLFDKRNIIKLNQYGVCKPFDENKDEIDRDHQLIILRYFNAQKRETNTIQYLLCHKSINYQQILSYLQYDFIAINQTQKEFKMNVNNKRTNKSRNNMFCIQYRISDGPRIPRIPIFKHAKFEWKNVEKKFMDKPISSLFQYNKCMVIRFVLNSDKTCINNYDSTNRKNNNGDYPCLR